MVNVFDVKMRLQRQKLTLLVSCKASKQERRHLTGVLLCLQLFGVLFPSSGEPYCLSLGVSATSNLGYLVKGFLFHLDLKPSLVFCLCAVQNPSM